MVRSRELGWGYWGDSKHCFSGAVCAGVGGAEITTLTAMPDEQGSPEGSPVASLPNTPRDPARLSLDLPSTASPALLPTTTSLLRQRNG